MRDRIYVILIAIEQTRRGKPRKNEDYEEKKETRQAMSLFVVFVSSW